MDSPYDVLGIDRDADDEEVVRAYRRRVKETHPDHGGSASEFQAVLTAYAQIEADEGEGVAESESFEYGTDEVGAREPPATTHVEYLDYEVLDDHRWHLDDDDLFEKAAAAGLDPDDYGEFEVLPHQSLLEAAEACGLVWPYACRGGACANCAVVVREGDLRIPVDHILPDEMMDRDIRLSCNAVPTSEELRVVYNVKHLPDLDDLRLPPGPFEHATAKQ